MSAPNDYGQQAAFQQGQQAPYADDGQAYGNPVGSPPPQATQQPGEGGGKKKKRAYAAQAFDVGSGANAAVGGQLPGGGQFGTPQPMAAGYGYPGQDAQPQPAPYGAPQTYGSPAPATPGFQPPDAYGAPAPGVAGITQGMAGMQMGPGPGQPAPQQMPPQAQPRVGPLNQLYPTDLLNQPFNVSELDLPPPPIILPPNVGSPPGSRALAVQALTRKIVQLYSFPGGELPAQVYPIHAQRCAYDALPPQEVQAAFCPGHTAIHVAS